MHLQKTTAKTAGVKSAPEPTAKNVSSKTPLTQASKTSPPPAVPRSVSSLAAAAGLPQDKLSASIVAFARFFSLPLKPELLAAIRRHAFLPQGAASQQMPAASPAAEDASGLLAAKTREALSLSAAAAESKGVELYPKGLETYAEAVDPEWQRRQNSGGKKREQQNKKQDEQEKEKAPLKAGSITASGLQKMAIESAEKNPLLAVLNKLPGKNGQRWIVLPFDFFEGGRKFSVSIRILLEELKSNRAVCMALDIAESGETERRWLFMLESANDKAMRLTSFIQSELPPKAQSRLKNELSALLEIPPERVFVKSSGESFSCEASCGEFLPNR
jgi:hypothetical protein